MVFAGVVGPQVAAKCLSSTAQYMYLLYWCVQCTCIGVYNVRVLVGGNTNVIFIIQMSFLSFSHFLRCLSAPNLLYISN